MNRLEKTKCEVIDELEYEGWNDTHFIDSQCHYIIDEVAKRQCIEFSSFVLSRIVRINEKLDISIEELYIKYLNSI